MVRVYVQGVYVYLLSWREPPPAVARTIVIGFFERHGATLVPESDPLVFSRGRKVWSYLNPGPDTWPQQTITVTLEPIDSPDKTTISVTYDVKGWLIRMPPCGLRKEVLKLESEFKAQEASQQHLGQVSSESAPSAAPDEPSR